MNVHVRALLGAALAIGVLHCGGSEIVEPEVEPVDLTGAASEHYELRNAFIVPVLQTLSSQDYLARVAIGGPVILGHAGSDKFDLDPPTKLQKSGDDE